MQRLACLMLVLTTACGGGGTETGEAMLSAGDPPAKSAAAKPFTGADGAGNMVLGWKIELYKDAPGTGCAEDLTKVGTIGIYTNMTTGSAPQALLSEGAGITIVPDAPPTLLGPAAANVSIDGFPVGNGQVTISMFHLTPDAKHADLITGSISAGSTDGSAAITGTFDAPVCEE